MKRLEPALKMAQHTTRASRVLLNEQLGQEVNLLATRLPRPDSAALKSGHNVLHASILALSHVHRSMDCLRHAGCNLKRVSKAEVQQNKAVKGKFNISATSHDTHARSRLCRYYSIYKPVK
jgi:hypothetical protein